MSRKRHGTAERSIPSITRGRSDFGVEERTLVDVGLSSRAARDQGLIPSITGTNKPARAAKGSTPPPNVIPFTKPRAMAAVAAANPHALIIEESAGRALKGFDQTTSIHKQDEATSKFMSNIGAGRSANDALPPAATRVATGWTPPGAVPTAPVAKLPPSAQTMVPAAANTALPGPVNATVVPVPALHTVQTSSPVLALPPLHVPSGVTPMSRPAPSPAPAPAPAYRAPPAAIAYAAAAYPPAPAQQPSHTMAAPMPIAAWPVAQAAPPAPVQAPVPVAAQPAELVHAFDEPPIGDMVMAPQKKPGFFDQLKERLQRDPTASDAASGKWAVFERLGLGAPKKLLANPQKLIVNAYRLLGFVILTIIVVVLVGYIANTAFFYMSSSWVVPMAVSATDEKVVTLQAQLAEQQNSRDKIADELAQADRAIRMQQNFQLAFAKAIKSDLDGRKAALGRMRSLANTAAATRVAIKSQNAAYANASRKKMQKEYDAGLIDRNAMLSGKFQLAQITSSNLSLVERQAEFETKAAELEAETRSLDAILANIDDKDTALSYEVLRIKQEYAASRLDLAKAIETRNTLKASLARQDKIVGSLKKSSYLRAVEDGAAVAFVPYGNLGNVSKGTDVYACKVGMIFCYHVGEVLEVLPGEVQFKHPQRDRMLRGQMIEMKLDDDDADAAAGDVLFVGGKPLLI